MTAINYVRDLPGGGVVAARGAPHPGLAAAHGYCGQASPPRTGTAPRPRRRARVLRSGLAAARGAPHPGLAAALHADGDGGLAA